MKRTERHYFQRILSCCVILVLVLCSCSGNNASETDKGGYDTSADTTPAVTGDPAATAASDVTADPAGTDTGSGEGSANGTETDNTDEQEEEPVKLTEAYKRYDNSNPIFTQHFGADPYAIEYDGRLYIYMTADAFEYDAQGEVKDNTYSKIRSIYVVSTDDMINFTDHGEIPVAGPKGAAKGANNSWAPAACWKMIDGKPRFFLYFADNGGGIGVLTSDSPTGPFSDPLGHALISRSIPNCGNVLWLFDPAVLVDDDGTGDLYFGGGVPEGKVADPGTGRVAKLRYDQCGRRRCNTGCSLSV